MPFLKQFENIEDVRFDQLVMLPQVDQMSCGVYMCMAVNMICSNKQKHPTDPILYRRKILYELCVSSIKMDTSLKNKLEDSFHGLLFQGLPNFFSKLLVQCCNPVHLFHDSQPVFYKKISSRRISSHCQHHECVSQPGGLSFNKS